MNRVFDSADLVAVLEAGEYEDKIPLNAGWATGDWDGDKDFSTGDPVLAFRDGGYDAGPRPVVKAVPEPSGMGMLAIAALLAAVSSNHRQGRGC